MCLVLEWKTGLWAKAIDPWLSPFSGMTVDLSDLLPPPTHDILVFVDVSYTRVALGDPDEGVSLVGLEESQLREQQT